MKVAFLIYSLGRGGAERATVNLANQFVVQGWDVAIITVNSNILPAYALTDGVSSTCLGLQTNSNSLFAGVYNNVKRIFQIRKYIKDEKIDILIGMSSTYNNLASLASMLTPTSAAGSERTNPEVEPIQRSWSLSRKYGYRLLDLLICLTDETHIWLTKFTNAKRIVTIPNGVELPIASSPPVVPFTAHRKDKKYLISVCRLVATKCVDHTLKAFAELIESHPDWELLIIGDGPDKEKLVKLHKELGLIDKTHFVGSVGNLDEWYSKADIFVSSSIHEGFPNSLLEAMAYGLAPVSYDCPTGPRDLIVNDVNGILVPMADEKALKEALNGLMANGSRREVIALEARKCRHKFSIETVAERWMTELKNAVA